MEVYTKTGKISQTFLKEVFNSEHRFLTIKAEISRLKKQKKKLGAFLEGACTDLYTLIEDNSEKISPGTFTVKIMELVKTRRVAWKEEFIKIKGEDEAERISASLLPKTLLIGKVVLREKK